MVGEIIIRQAMDTDMNEIWELIRTEQDLWNIEKISANMNNLFVIIYGRKLIGVLNGTFTPTGGKIDIAAVNPVYPQSSIVAAMACALSGVLRRKPVSDIYIKEKSIAKYVMEGARNGFSGRQRFRISNIPTTEGADSIFSSERFASTRYKSTDSKGFG